MDEISKVYNCCDGTIYRRLKEFNLPLPRKRSKRWITKEMLSEQLSKGLTGMEIAKNLHCALSTVDRLCHTYELPMPVIKHTRARSKTFDTRFFKTIDSEEKAYMLGFISADGGRDRNWGIKISLHPKDTEILEKFAKILNCNYGPELVEHGTRIKLALYDIDMVKDLEQYGVVERKTFTLPFAKNVPEHLIPHYFRGMFDGDGSIARVKGQAHFVCGSDAFIEGLLSWAKHKYGYDLWTNRVGRKTYLVIRKREAKLMHDMYGNAKIYLERKKKLYDKFWVKQ